VACCRLGVDLSQNLRSRPALNLGSDAEEVFADAAGLAFEPPRAVLAQVDAGAGTMVLVERTDHSTAADSSPGCLELADKGVSVASYGIKPAGHTITPASRRMSSASVSVGSQSTSPRFGSGFAGISSSHRPWLRNVLG